MGLRGIRAGRAYVEIDSDESGLVRGLRNAENKFHSFKKAIGSRAALAAAAGLVALGRSAETFDQAMTRSLSIMGDVGDAMRKDMAEAAMEVSRTTTSSASQAAEAYYFLASAGMSAEQSISAMPQVAKFAQAGMFDLATATDLATDAQSALGLSVKDPAKNLENMTRVTDVLVQSSILANATTEQFSRALTNQAGAAMRDVGMEIEEGAAILAAFADQGIKGEEAGTKLAIVLRDLQTKAGQNASAFEAAGVSVFDSQGEMRKMADILSDLENKLEGASDKTRKMTLLQLGFSDKSVGALQSLIGLSRKIGDYEKALELAGGQTDKVAGKTMTKFQESLAKMRSSWERLSNFLGGPLMETLASVLDWLDAVVRKVAEFNGAVMRLVGILPKLQDAAPEEDWLKDRPTLDTEADRKILAMWDEPAKKQVEAAEESTRNSDSIAKKMDELKAEVEKRFGNRSNEELTIDQLRKDGATPDELLGAIGLQSQLLSLELQKSLKERSEEFANRPELVAAQRGSESAFQVLNELNPNRQTQDSPEVQKLQKTIDVLQEMKRELESLNEKADEERPIEEVEI